MERLDVGEGGNIGDIGARGGQATAGTGFDGEGVAFEAGIGEEIFTVNDGIGGHGIAVDEKGDRGGIEGLVIAGVEKEASMGKVDEGAFSGLRNTVDHQLGRRGVILDF